MNKKHMIAELRKYVKPSRIVRGTVSVIIPFYRNFDVKRAMLSIESILGQKGIDVDLVVTEENQEPLLEGKLPVDVKYIFTSVKELSEGKLFRPGFVRNLAAKNSCGEFLYNNDGDIVFQSQTFLMDLVNLINQNENLALYQPQMRRLPIECFDEFQSSVGERGLWQAIAELDRSQPYAVTTENNRIIMRVFRKFEYGKERIFLYTAPDHKRYLSDPNNKGKEPLFSTLHIHAGGVLMRREQFDLVGGYSQGFAAWGCHDEDIQWKLGELFDLRQIPEDLKYEIIHLDHSRDYFSKERWSKNIDSKAQRQARGIVPCCIEDILYLNNIQTNGTR